MHHEYLSEQDKEDILFGIQNEVDFVAEKSSGLIYIQVTESLISQETLQRELRPLIHIKDNYPKYILSMDWDFNASYEGILSMNIIDWMMQRP